MVSPLTGLRTWWGHFLSGLMFSLDPLASYFGGPFQLSVGFSLALASVGLVFGVKCVFFSGAPSIPGMGYNLWRQLTICGIFIDRASSLLAWAIPLSLGHSLTWTFSLVGAFSWPRMVSLFLSLRASNVLWGKSFFWHLL